MDKESEIHSDTLERIVPDQISAGEATGDETLKLHLERYAFASPYLGQGVVLDMACGVGYGTYHLAKCAPAGVTKVVGVDVSETAIAYARQRYTHPLIDFQVADATKFIYSEPLSTIVSLETIEHIPNPQMFVKHLKQMLRPNGHLIGSVPVTPSVDANPHHLTDFTARSFRRMFLNLGFKEVDNLVQVQSFSPFRILLRKERRMQHMRKNLPGYYLRHPNAVLKRLWSAAQYGFTNRYLTCAWKLQS